MEKEVLKNCMFLRPKIYKLPRPSRWPRFVHPRSCSIAHRIRSIQNAQQAIQHSSVIFVAPYWNYRISCLKVQLAPLAQDADFEKWNISLDYVKKGLSPDLEYFRLQRDLD